MKQAEHQNKMSRDRLTLQYRTSSLLNPTGKMSKPSPRLDRPGSAGCKSPSMRKELQRNRSCMLRIGERLMRAGSEGNLVQRVVPAQSQTSSAGLKQGSNSQTPAPVQGGKHSIESIGNNSSKGATSSCGPACHAAPANALAISLLGLGLLATHI